MSKSGQLFTFRLIPMISVMLARRGIDAAKAIGDAGLPADALHGEVTAPLGRIQDFIDRAAVALAAPHLGFALADALGGGTYGLAEFLCRSAPTVEAGLVAISEVGALINPIGRFHVVRGDDGARMHYAVVSERATLGTHLNEFTIAYIVRQIALVTGGLPLRRVWFSHVRATDAGHGPASVGSLTRGGADVVAQRFACPVEYGADDCGFALAREVAMLVPRTADALLFEFLHGQARTQLGRLASTDVVAQLVRVIEVRLARGEVDAGAVAAAMAMSARTLQRQLSEAGTSYRDVLAHVRNRKRAELEGRASESEIARALGFSDARAMRRSLDD